MLRLHGVFRCATQSVEPEASTSALAKQIWKTAVRGTRVGSIWTQFSRQVTAHVAYLTPRDVSMVIHSFARIKFKDEKLLIQIIPTVIKHMNEFSVRELVSILSAFRKLEFPTQKINCLSLMINQLQLRRSQWTPMDVALIANAVSWFRVSEVDIWKSIEKKCLVCVGDMSSLGLSLVVGALARMDMRNERLLKVLASQFVKGDIEGLQISEPMLQESLAVLINGFAKLDWNPHGLFDFIEAEVDQILSSGVSFFDAQSACLVIHALIALRFEYIGNQLEERLDRVITTLIELLQSQIKSQSWKPSVDQLEKLSAVHAIFKYQLTLSESTQKNMYALNYILRPPSRSTKSPDERVRRGKKLPRWEYEVFRIMKTKMAADVRKEYRPNGRVDVVLKPSSSSSETPIIINCIGPFQYYANSTKRTVVSRLNQQLTLLTRSARFIEIPYYIWNELKTDQDKIMFLMSKGRQVLDSNVDTS